jgi:hypothetical protein
MQAKTGNWMVGAGAVIAVLGLLLLPSALLENSGDRNLLGIGMTVFAIGVLSVSSGIYLKALNLKSFPTTKKAAPDAAPSRPLRGGCDRCQREMPVVQCKVHQQQLCGTCLADHYDFRSCVYTPSGRRTAAKSMAARTL